MKTIIHAPDINKLISELKSAKDGKLKDVDYEKLADLLTKIYENYNPLENEINRSGYNLDWKVSPDLSNLLNTKLEIGLSKELINEDVELQFNVSGKPCLLKSESGESNFKATISAKIKY